MIQVHLNDLNQASIHQLCNQISEENIWLSLSQLKQCKNLYRKLPVVLYSASAYHSDGKTILHHTIERN